MSIEQRKANGMCDSTARWKIASDRICTRLKLSGKIGNKYTHTHTQNCDATKNDLFAFPSPYTWMNAFTPILQRSACETEKIAVWRQVNKCAYWPFNRTISAWTNRSQAQKANAPQLPDRMWMANRTLHLPLVRMQFFFLSHHFRVNGLMGFPFLWNHFIRWI